MIKILHLLNTSSFSGAENVVITLASNLGPEFISYYSSYDGSISEVLSDNGIEFIPFKMLSAKEVKRIVDYLKPDIIHAHDFRASVIASFSVFNIPIVSHLHNNASWIKRINLYTIIYLLASLNFKKIIGVSNSIFDEYVFSRFIKKKITVIKNPIDIKRIRSMSTIKLDNSLTCDLVFIGRLSQEKDPLRFINIVSMVKRRIPEINAVIIGSGVLFNDCAELINSLELRSNIKMLGFVQNPFNILVNAKLLCMTSKWEGYGLAAIEALSLGIPVVATSVGGLVEIVNKDCGRLVDNDLDFVSEICENLENTVAYKLKCINAIETARNLVDLKGTVREFSDIYHCLFIGKQRS